MDDHASPALRRLLDSRADAVLETHAQHGDATAVIDPTRVVEVCTFLRDDPECRFQMLTDLTAVDYLGRTPRFEVVYHLHSLERKMRLRLKARVPEDHCEIDTVKAVWPAADWLEREVWDMYGISFRNHGDLRRLLLYEEFEGHPLRKDYAKEHRQPLVGPRN